MVQRKLYILTIEINSETDECETLTEQWVYPDLELTVGDIDLTDHFDEEAIELCMDCDDIGIT
tara:strand:+ start:620 stop:808 length:189 start_codon:yes stop_codon:yes gene_type:complete